MPPLTESARHTLGELDAALQWLERGTDGICERCRNAVEPCRLEARPTNTLRLLRPGNRPLSCDERAPGHVRADRCPGDSAATLRRGSRIRPIVVGAGQLDVVAGDDRRVVENRWS